MPAHRYTREELAGAERAAFGLALQARLQDVDAAGVVFFARVFEYFHDALMAFLESAGFPIPRLLHEGRVLSPIAHAEADYFQPVRFGDRLQAEVVKAHVEGSRVTIGYRLVRADSGVPVAVGQTVHACVDAKTFARTELPAGFREALSRI
ncbi:MAG: acyl-CoA thioesterase [Acidobacteria bacterium]|nr:acyl-CoA thioesterase [Acidobacteriota bacterium]